MNSTARIYSSYSSIDKYLDSLGNFLINTNIQDMLEHNELFRNPPSLIISAPPDLQQDAMGYEYATEAIHAAWHFRYKPEVCELNRISNVLCEELQDNLTLDEGVYGLLPIKKEYYCFESQEEIKIDTTFNNGKKASGYMEFCLLEKNKRVFHVISYFPNTKMATPTGLEGFDFFQYSIQSYAMSFSGGEDILNRTRFNNEHPVYNLWKI